MKRVVGYMLLAAFWLGACAPVKPAGEPAGVPEKGIGAAPDVQFGRACTPAEAKDFLQQAGDDPAAAFRGAACWIYLAEQEQKDTPDRLAAARKGRQLAVAAVDAWPKSGLAHYLLAYLTGLVAEGSPLQGLELVPVIEREALLAARLDPGIDQGGPERMLGELYLRAPGFPVSIGDPAQATEHYRRAVKLAPAYNPNRLGLVEALLADEQPAEACRELHELFRQGFSQVEKEGDWLKALELQHDLCGRIR
ncbi:MAG: hypothetical protein R2940_10760 [Syntrophotaleaceae bacterium]